MNGDFNNNQKKIIKLRNNINFNNLKIINDNPKNKNKTKENSLKKKLIKNNFLELKPYNKLVNQINININNISRSIQKSKPFVTNNNVINLNVILNDSLNNNKNFDSLQMNNNIASINKNNAPTTPSQMRFIPSKKSTFPLINISERIKPKITAHKFKSINNTKYINTESNYDRIERQKKIFLDNVVKKHEYLRLNYPKNYKINTNIYNY